MGTLCARKALPEPRGHTCSFYSFLYTQKVNAIQLAILFYQKKYVLALRASESLLMWRAICNPDELPSPVPHCRFSSCRKANVARSAWRPGARPALRTLVTASPVLCPGAQWTWVRLGAGVVP